jgi:hypothetical protein
MKSLKMVVKNTIFAGEKAPTRSGTEIITVIGSMEDFHNKEINVLPAAGRPNFYYGIDNGFYWHESWLTFKDDNVVNKLSITISEDGTPIYDCKS